MDNLLVSWQSAYDYYCLCYYPFHELLILIKKPNQHIFLFFFPHTRQTRCEILKSAKSRAETYYPNFDRTSSTGDIRRICTQNLYYQTIPKRQDFETHRFSVFVLPVDTTLFKGSWPDLNLALQSIHTPYLWTTAWPDHSILNIRRKYFQYSWNASVSSRFSSSYETQRWLCHDLDRDLVFLWRPCHHLWRSTKYRGLCTHFS